MTQVTKSGEPPRNPRSEGLLGLRHASLSSYAVGSEMPAYKDNPVSAQLEAPEGLRGEGLGFMGFDLGI